MVAEKFHALRHHPKNHTIAYQAPADAFIHQPNQADNAGNDQETTRICGVVRPARKCVQWRGIKIKRAVEKCHGTFADCFPNRGIMRKPRAPR